MSDAPVASAVVVPWGDFAADRPDFASEVRERFEAHPHHVLATVRRDGRPRVNGTNVMFGDGILWLGTMTGSRKAADLSRDPRCALHSAPLEEDLGSGDGDATIDAVARTLGDADAVDLLRGEFGDDATLDGAVWSLSLRTVAVVEVRGEQLRIRSWTPAGGLTEVLRD